MIRQDLTKTRYVPPFRKGGDKVLVAVLNDHQRHHDVQRSEDRTDPLAPQAICSAEVLRVLNELGLQEGFDAAATELFFGEDGREGYRDGDERFAIDTHGGFIFTDPTEGDIYTITASRASGSSVPQHRVRSTTPAYKDTPGPGGHPGRRGGRRLLAALSRRVPREPLPELALSWSVSARATGYQVQPRFYENIGSHDLLPFADDVADPDDAGLASLYPVDREERVCLQTGNVTVQTAGEANQLAETLGAVMAEHGVLCDPRVVLLDGPSLPLLPRHARREHLYGIQARERRAEGEGEDEQLSGDEIFLGGPCYPDLEGDKGHRVRRECSPLTPDQQTAGWLARRAIVYSEFERRVSDLQDRLQDPNIPERRKSRILRQLQEQSGMRDEARSVLEGQTDPLAGLLLSVLDERPELVSEARRLES